MPQSIRALPPLVIAALALTALAPIADDTFKDWAEDKDLAKKIVVYDHLTGNVKKLKEAGIASPKRIGLVSFYLMDQGTSEFNAMAYRYGGTYERTAGLTPKGANHFATKFAETGVPALKKAFAAHGMELLEPIDFVTTPEQRQAYLDFELPMGGLGKATMSTVDWLNKNPTASSAAAGYKGIHATVWADAKGLTALEELRLQLGVDALVFVGTKSGSYDKGVIMAGTVLLMVGPNPIPKPPQRLAQISWSCTGMAYARGDFAKGFKGVEFAKIKKGKIESEEYDGFAKIMEVLADEVLKAFDAQYGK